MSAHREKERFFIAFKANRVLQIVLLVLLILFIRLYQLSVLQHDTLSQEAQKPKKRFAYTTSPRATIRDRFNIPLAYNKMSYTLSLVYAHIQDIPSIEYKTDEQGNKIKIFKRKEYIQTLTELLSKELGLDADHLKDEIYSKALFFGTRPYTIKENLSEEQFYRFKLLEKDYPGLLAQIVPKRYYPLGRTAAHIVGYVGPIDRNEYIAILQEIETLKIFIENDEEGIAEPPAGIATNREARERLKELQERAYQINDQVGKAGIEQQFEEQLRGYRGLRSYLTNAKGNIIQTLPESRVAIPGERILLTLSSELQSFAENLLIENEKIRDQRIGRDESKVIDQPWIKGGAIVAIEPKSGEILALASYPRFDPNDFIANATEQKWRWMESEQLLASIWDGEVPLSRETMQGDEHLFLDWKRYLNFIAPKQSALYKVISRIQTLEQLIILQKALKPFERFNIPALINFLYPQDKLYPDNMGKVERALLFEKTDLSSLRGLLDPYLKEIPHNRDKLLGLDIVRLVANEADFSPALLEKVGKLSLETFRKQSMAFVCIENFVKQQARTLFHHTDFKTWRQENEQSFLKEKRAQEKLKKAYAKPYLDYIEEEEEAQFQRFWKDHGWSLILTFLKGSRGNEELYTYQKHFQAWYYEIANGAHGLSSWRTAYNTLCQSIEGLDTPSTREFLQSLRRFENLNRPLWGRYKALREDNNQQLEKHLAMAFYPKFGFGCSRAQAFRQSCSQGSIFKLMTTYAVLKQRQEELKNTQLRFSLLNPLTLDERKITEGKNSYIAQKQDGTLIPQLYKKGRLCTSVRKEIGLIDVIGAIENSSNPYFSLIAAENLKSPNDLVETARLFGYGTKTGILLPGEITGHLPADLVGEQNQTAIYCFAIGQHTLVNTPLQTAAMASALANGGDLLVPKIVSLTVGSYPNYAGRGHAHFPFEESLQTIGIQFPLFLATAKASTQPVLNHYPSLKKKEIELPTPLRNVILEGMRQVVNDGQEGGMWGLRHYFGKNQEPVESYQRLKQQMVGKTGTAECVEILNLDQESGTKKCCQIWFAGLAFDHELKAHERSQLCTEKDLFGEAELVVIVYLRHGGYGKDAAPLGAQVIEKWRSITKTK